MVCTDALRWRSDWRNLSIAFSTAVRLDFVAIGARTNPTTETQRTILLSLCLRDSVVKESIVPSLSDGASGTRSSADQAPSAYKLAWSKYRHGPGWSEPCAGPRHFRPCAWRNCGATYADWHCVPCSQMRLEPLARRADE